MCILWDMGNKKGAYCYAPNPDPDDPDPDEVRPDCLFHVHDKRVAVYVTGKNPEPFRVMVLAEVRLFFHIYWFRSSVVFQRPLAKVLEWLFFLIFEPACIAVEKCGCPKVGQLQCDCFDCHCLFPYAKSCAASNGDNHLCVPLSYAFMIQVLDSFLTKSVCPASIAFVIR